MFLLKIKPNLNFLSQLQILNSAISRNFSETLEPVKLSYATYEKTEKSDAPNGPPFVVIHGLFGSKSNWNSLCKAYQQKCHPPRKIVAIDVRNHGDSMKSDKHSYAHLAVDLKAFLEEMKFNKVALMGHSMGGRAAMLFALKYPEYVERLIVADISPVTISPSLSSMPSLFTVLERVNLPKNVPMSQARATVDKQLATSIPDKDLRSFLLTNLVQSDDGSYKWRINITSLIKNFNNIARFPDTNNLQYVGPTFFIAGGNSDFVPKSDYSKILKLFPNAELKYIEGAGHWLHSEKPNEFLKLTLDFLNKNVQT